MDLTSLIASFSTGTYTVTRRARGATVRGRVGSPTETTFTITASVSPAKGSDLVKLPEGRRTNETRAIFTVTQLKIGGQGDSNEADRVVIGGEGYEVLHVETWNDPSSGGTAYRCLAVALR